jgi:hypothetical protein
MTIFEDREKGQEQKFQHDQELAFKIKARRNRLLGYWAAERLGMRDNAAGAYAEEIVAADFQKPGDDDIVEKVLGDLSAKGVVVSEAQLRDELRRLGDAAKKQIMGA